MSDFGKAPLSPVSAVVDSDGNRIMTKRHLCSPGRLLCHLLGSSKGIRLFSRMGGEHGTNPGHQRYLVAMSNSSYLVRTTNKNKKPWCWTIFV